MTWLRIDKALRASPGTRATVKGWVRTRRDSKAGLSFINLNDGSCFGDLQIVAPAELGNYAHEVTRLTTGCSIEVDGELVESQGKGQSVELRADTIRVLGWVEDPDTYPVSAKRHSFEYLREVAHLRVRTNTFGAVARVRNCLAQAVHRFYHERGFSWIHTPIVTASDCEGAGEMFRVTTLPDDKLAREAEDFFGKRAYLTVSGQLEGEAFACALSNIY
ncbi:MAG: OB-fold nucleic acid binding domain-containing protein, partial [Phycisphaerales bacterium]